MAITIIQQRQKQKYLILVFLAVVLLSFVVIWRGFLSKSETSILPSPAPLPPPKVEISFEVLKSPILKELQLLEKIEPFEGEIGRENPFLPY